MCKMRMVLRFFLRTLRVKCGCRRNIITWKNMYISLKSSLPA